mgnify:FL=1
MSRYNSSKSVGYRKPVWLDSNDPRARSEYELEKFRSRIGAEVLVKDKVIKNIELEEYNPKNHFYSVITASSPGIPIWGFDMGPDGSVIVSVAKFITGEWYFDGKIVKYSPDGNTLWQKEYFRDGQHVTTDSIVTMSNGDSVLFFQNFVKVSGSSGNILSTKAYPNTFFGNLSRDSSNNIYGYNFSVDANLNFRWENNYDIPDHYVYFEDKSRNIVNGYFYIVGSAEVSSSPYTPSAFIAKVNASDGSIAWARQLYPPSGYNMIEAYRVEADSTGVYLSGQTYNGTDYVTWVAKYDTNGNFVWGKKIGYFSIYNTSISIIGTNIYILYSNVYMVSLKNDGTFRFIRHLDVPITLGSIGPKTDSANMYLAGIESSYPNPYNAFVAKIYPEISTQNNQTLGSYNITDTEISGSVSTIAFTSSSSAFYRTSVSEIPGIEATYTQNDVSLTITTKAF